MANCVLLSKRRRLLMSMMSEKWFGKSAPNTEFFNISDNEQPLDGAA